MFYMHTLDGKPAYYVDGEQVCFIDSRPGKLARSLDEIRAQWTASEAWRKKRGYGPMIYPHGYKKVTLP